MTLVAIHQPNFFPWLGYFDKIRRADVFVFLDEVDYPRSGSGGMGSWVNRVRVDIHGEARWLTCPLRKLALGDPISAARIDDSRNWRGKAMKTLDASYAHAPRRNDAIAEIEPLLMRDTDRLAEYNMANIQALAARLSLSTRFLRQSELRTEGTSTARLVSIVEAAGGTAYLSGGGAGGYQEKDLFADAGIKLVMQSFEPSPYGERSPFLAGLSVIDYLMHDARPIGSSPC